MSTTYANTINGDAIYAERSVQDKDGNQIDTTYAKIASLATVATTGDYNDLSNKPTIPAAQVQSDWTESDSNDPSYIQNKPTLAAVATSGDYSDLSNTPSIPSGSDLVPPYDPSTDNGKVLTVGSSTTYWAVPGNAPVTDVTVDGSSVVNGQGVAQITTPTVDQSYNAASTNAQAGVAVAGAISNIRQVPTTTSSDNGKVLGVVDSSGTLGWVAGGSQQVQSDWTETNTSDPSYIQNKPTTDTLVGGSNITISTANNTVTISATAVQPSDLATVATTGSYNDLLNKPTIPAAQVNSDWNASSGVAKILNKPTILPYKPVVAGTGVRIVNDTANNRIVVEADETVLWSGSVEASANNTATVSESPNHFEYLRFEYHRGDLTATHTVFRAADNGTTYGRISCSLDTVNIDSTQNNVYMFTGSFSGTTFTVVNHSTKIYLASTFSTSTTSPLTLTKIVGVNRIASN